MGPTYKSPRVIPDCLSYGLPMTRQTSAIHLTQAMTRKVTSAVPMVMPRRCYLGKMGISWLRRSAVAPLPTGATTITPTHRLTACRWCWLAVTRATGRMRASRTCIRIMCLPLRIVTSVLAFAFSQNINQLK